MDDPLEHIGGAGVSADEAEPVPELPVYDPADDVIRIFHDSNFRAMLWFDETRLTLDTVEYQYFYRITGRSYRLVQHLQACSRGPHPPRRVQRQLRQLRCVLTTRMWELFDCFYEDLRLTSFITIGQRMADLNTTMRLTQRALQLSSNHYYPAYQRGPVY